MHKPVRINRHGVGGKMRRITVAESREMLSLLKRWHSPAELRPLLGHLQTPFGFYAVSQRAMRPWREAFCALGFAETLGADAVRLGDDPPDFYLRFGELVHPCELVEVRPPDRRVGREFNNYAALHNAGATVPTEMFDPLQRIIGLEAWLTEQMEKKAAKPYPAETILAVRAEVMWMPSLDDYIRSAINNAAAQFTSRFRAVWVSTSHRLYAFQDDSFEPLAAAGVPLGRTTLSRWALPRHVRKSRHD